MRTLALMLAATAALAPAIGRGAEVANPELLADLASPAEEPMGLALDGDALIVADLATRTALRVKTSDGSVLAKFPLAGMMPTGIALHKGTLYSAERGSDLLRRKLLAGGADPAPLPFYERWPMGMVHDGEHLWVVNTRDAKVHKLDPEDGTTIASFEAPAGAPTGIAFDGRDLWIADHGTDELYRVDRRDGTVLFGLPSPGPYPNALAADGDSLWVADYQTRRLQRVKLPSAPGLREDKPRRVQASYGVTYRARGVGRVVGLTAYLALPRELPGQRLLGELKLTPEPTRIVADRWGQRIAVFELGDLASGELKAVRWEGDFATFRTRFLLMPEKIAAPNVNDPTLVPYLADDTKYDLAAPAMAELVARLTKGKANTYEKARAIYEHLAKTITYDRSGGWNNAAAVLERGTGSCSEYTFALVALLRKAKIPARYVGAISERGDEASFDDVFHRWAEAYFPGYGWVPLDANAAHGGKPGERASFFGGRTNRHVVTTISGGESEQLGWNYNSDEKYKVEGEATLEVQPLARYRPLEAREEGDAASPRIVDLEPAPRGAPAFGLVEIGAAVVGLLGVGTLLGRIAFRAKR